MELLDGENIVWQGRPTWRGTLSLYVKGVLPFVLLALVPIWILEDYKGIIWAIAAIGAGITILYGWIQRISTRYVVTDRRLYISKGLLGRSDIATSVERIQDVNLRQTALDRVLNVGDVEVETAGNEDDNFNFARIADPKDKVKLLAQMQHAVDTGTSRRQGL